LSHEIIEEFVVRQNEEKPFDDLMDLVDQIIPFDMAHNAEPAACDLLLEVERLGSILDYVDEKNYERVCLYLLGNARYTPEPEDSEILKLVVNIYRKLNKYPEAVAVALQLDDAPLAQEILNSCEDRYVITI
jgi:26S proteasome regulatory subunit N1